MQLLFLALRLILPLYSPRCRPGRYSRTASVKKESYLRDYCMHQAFKRGDRVTWNSEAGRVTGIIQKKITSDILFKGYKRHASKTEPQYIIKSDKTGHIAVHKATALRRISAKRVA